MIDDSGFRHLRLKLMAPGLPEAKVGLDRLFQCPDVSSTLLEAGMVNGHPFFEIEIFGASSIVNEVLKQVDELLKPHPKESTNLDSNLTVPEEAHV